MRKDKTLLSLRPLLLFLTLTLAGYVVRPIDGIRNNPAA